MRTNLLLCLYLLVLSSCSKELDFVYHDIPPLTVIEGELTPEGPRIALTLTTPMDEAITNAKITDASVILEDITSGTVENLHPDGDGFFTGESRAMIGNVYRLSVERGGVTNEAVATMFGPSEILGIEFNWISMPYDKVAVLQAKFRDDAAVRGECFWVKVYRNGKIYLWDEVDDRYAHGGVMTYTRMTTRKDIDEEDEDSVILDGDVITVSVSRISREMHDYLEALQNDSSGPAMFSGERCLGYFIATSPVSASVVFHPDDIQEYIAQ